jgi:hypothetical protein
MKKLVEVWQAQVTKFLLPQEGAFGYLPPLVKAIQERYQFVGVPEAIEQLLPTDPTKGTTFRHGQFGSKRVVIDNLQLFFFGLIASTRSATTDDTEMFLDDFLAWLGSEFKLRFGQVRPQTYWSQLEFQLHRPMSEYFPKAMAVGREIPQLVGEFWTGVAPFELTSVTLSCDPAKTTGGSPAGFKVERRAGIPFEQNLYLSEAQLRTKDHLRLLQSLFPD